LIESVLFLFVVDAEDIEMEAEDDAKADTSSPKHRALSAIFSQFYVMYLLATRQQTDDVH